MGWALGLPMAQLMVVEQSVAPSTTASSSNDNQSKQWGSRWHGQWWGYGTRHSMASGGSAWSGSLGQSKTGERGMSRLKLTLRITWEFNHTPHLKRTRKKRRTCDVVNYYSHRGVTNVRWNETAESFLAGRVPQLQSNLRAHNNTSTNWKSCTTNLYVSASDLPIASPSHLNCNFIVKIRTWEVYLATKPQE